MLWATATVVVLVPLLLLFEVARDLACGKNTFFRFFEKLPTTQRLLYNLGAVLWVLSCWYFMSYADLVPRRYLPTPTAALEALWSSVSSGELLRNGFVSVVRVIGAVALASTLGLLIGTLAGTFARIGALALPINSAFRYIPPTAFIGLTIIWFGIGEGSKVSLIFLGIIFYVIQMAADVVSNVPRVFVEAAFTLGATRREVVKYVVLPFALPDLLAVLRINLGAAWTFLIVAELVAAQKGLGYLMAVSQRFLQTPKLFSLLLVVGVLGFASDALFASIIRRVGRWR